MRWCGIATDFASEVVVFAILWIGGCPIHLEADCVDSEKRDREGLLAIWVCQMGRIGEDRRNELGVHLCGVSAPIRVVQQDLFAEQGLHQRLCDGRVYGTSPTPI